MKQARQRQFDLLVFDWDGTLFDSTALIAHCIQGACDDVGCTKPDWQTAKDVIGLGITEALQHAVPDLPASRYAELAQCYRNRYFAHQDEVILFEGVPEFLQNCRQAGYLLAVATGKSRRGLNEALEKVGLRTMFDDTRTADETISKPNPLMLIELMQVLDTSAQRTLMIGDTTHDLQMAINAGVRSLGVSHGAHTPATLLSFGEQGGTLGIVHSIAEMEKWLAEHG